MKDILYIFSVGIIVGFLVFTSMINIVHAETGVGSDLYITSDTLWDISGSPYILNRNVIVASGATLTIGSGVEIYSVGQRSISVLGTLLSRGDTVLPVFIHDLGELYASDGGTIMLEYTNLSNMVKAVHIDGSRAIIATSTISGSKEYGILSSSSGLSVWDSMIVENVEGIHIDRSPGPFLMRIDRQSPNYEIFSVNNALENLPTGSSLVAMTNSIIENNISAGVNSLDWVQAYMINNWWGSSSGPVVTPGRNVVLGNNILYEPWLIDSPVLNFHKKECCSSVLFLPGLEASRMYRRENSVFGASNINRLWEPNTNADVKKLFLDKNGSSTDTSIYVGEPIDKALGIVGVYDSFMGFLDDLVSRGIIGEWKSYGYDWRKPIVEVVAGRESRATTTDQLIEVLESLAKRSKTGKVSIIAHSNGGLVAKYLIKVLADIGKESLIDTVISVAVPYLGTPQAISSLLHGDSLSILGGAILKQSVARELGVNMASAYSLLPSPEYFKNVFDPTIAFASTTVSDVNRGQYPMNISSFDQQKSFILDEENNRVQPQNSETYLPIKGNSLLLYAAQALHMIIDPFSWPQSIAHWAIVGLGRVTVKGIEYSDKIQCRGPGKRSLCVKYLIHTASTTNYGDGTVVASSARYGSSNVVAVDLPSESQANGGNIFHSNILETPATQKTIESILKGRSDSDTEIVREISNIPHVSMGVSSYSNDTSLIVSTHSPVNLHIYDQNGRHTGLINPQVGISSSGGESIEEGLYSFYESNIPGSDFRIEESKYGNETYISLPGNYNQTYSVVIEGLSVGTFGYVIERVRSGNTIEKVEYSDIPVTPLTTATGTLIIRDINGDQIPKTSTIASSSGLIVDMDGNGSPDFVPKPNFRGDFILQLESIKKTIILITGNTKKSKDLLKRIDKIADRYHRGTIVRSDYLDARFRSLFKHKAFRSLTADEKDQIVSTIESFIARFE